jgi:Protein kinase domain
MLMPNGRPFLVMELLEGRELTRLLEPRKPLPPAEVAAIVEQIVEGLTAAHQRGVVHRDLKPGNIFLVTMPGTGREAVKLLDFGISKVRGATSNLTRTDTIMGTPHYMSPEQASGRTDEADGRTDQFALAAIAYEMLAGRMAFPGDDPASILYRVVHEQPPSLRSRVPTLPRAVEEVVSRGLAKRAEDRFPTVQAFGEALTRALRRWKEEPATSGRSSSPTPTPTSAPLLTPIPESTTTLRTSKGQIEAVKDGPPVRRAPWRRGLVVTGGVAVLVAGAVAAVNPRKESRVPPRLPAAIRPSPRSAPAVPPSAAPSAEGDVPNGETERAAIEVRFSGRAGSGAGAGVELSRNKKIAPSPAVLARRHVRGGQPSVRASSRVAVASGDGRAHGALPLAAQTTASPPASHPPPSGEGGAPSPAGDTVAAARASMDTGALRSNPTQPSLSPGHSDAARDQRIANASGAAIAATVRSHGDEVQDCFDRALMERSALHGRLTVRAMVDQTGRVESASATSTVEGGARLERCVVSAFKTWVFPQPTSGAHGMVTYSFSFEQDVGEQTPTGPPAR